MIKREQLSKLKDPNRVKHFIILKTRSYISSIIRTTRFLNHSKKLNKVDYLDIGCGPNISSSFVNLDYEWRPGIDVCWNLESGSLPFKDNTFRGIYSEHCFEHISFDSFIVNMQEIYRILKPGGTIRLIMPDGELYMDIYARKKNGENVKMPYEAVYISPMHRINGIFRNHGHKFIYDFQTIEIILKKAGFNNIKREEFMTGRDEKLLKDTESRAIESLYVEASK